METDDNYRFLNSCKYPTVSLLIAGRWQSAGRGCWDIRRTVTTGLVRACSWLGGGSRWGSLQTTRRHHLWARHFLHRLRGQGKYLYEVGDIGNGDFRKFVNLQYTVMLETVLIMHEKFWYQVKSVVHMGQEDNYNWHK